MPDPTVDLHVTALAAGGDGVARDAGGVPIEPVADPCPPLGWRRRARFHVAGGRVGLYREGSHDVLPIDSCPQLVPALDAAYRAVAAASPPDGELALALGHKGEVVVGVQKPWKLAEKVVDKAPPFGFVLELYAGSGNLTRGFRADGWEVTTSDLTPGCDLVGPADEVLARAKGPNGPFDAIVLDPPRTGAAEAVAGILAHAPRTVVNVSCDPATLARAAERLVAGGYRAERAWPIDLLPQTAHVEVVLRLVRKV